MLPLTVAAINYPGNKGFYEMAISDSGELAAVIPCAIVVEIAFFGRKRSLMGCYAIAGSILIGSYFTTGATFNGLIFVGLFFLSGCYLFYYPLVSESYHTKIRTSAIGLAETVGGFGPILMTVIG